MIWYIGLLVCAILAFFLAMRSMREFQDNPETKSTDYGLFLIPNTDALTQELFSALIDSLKGVISSFEQIQKGKGTALVGFFPHFIPSQFPSLGMVEIEDYILGRGQTQEDPFILSRQISVDDSFSWTLQPKKKNKPVLEKKSSLEFDLAPDQYTAIQLVCEPGEEKIQITPRLIIKERDPQGKIELIKKVKQTVDQKTTLTNNPSLIHAGVYEDYKKRTLVPKQVTSFLVNKKELLDFLS